MQKANCSVPGGTESESVLCLRCRRDTAANPDIMANNQPPNGRKRESQSHASFVEDQQSGDLHRIQVSKYDGKPYFRVGKPGSYQETAYPYDGKTLYESWYY